MKLQIDIPQRYAKQRAHTATHILHSELSTIFPQTKQAGSLVDEDMVRFDFYADRLLDDEEISSLEDHINKVIYQGHDVLVQEMKKTDAENLGAKMFFEDKYGEVVRVVQIADYKSIELCGGTHVTNTKEIGSFVIIWQQAVASGIKRITAYTGPKCLLALQEKNAVLKLVADKLSCKVPQIEERIEKTLKELKESKIIITQVMHELIDSLEFKEQTDKNNFKYEYCKINSSTLTKYLFAGAVLEYINKKWLGKTRVFEFEHEFLIYSTEGKAKMLMQDFGRKGGGNEQICQGRIS